MAFTDRTPQFREIVSKSSLSGAKTRKNGKAARRGHDEADDTQALLNKEYMREAYTILNHINNLARMLSSIRRAYLTVDSSSSSTLRQPIRELEFDGPEQSWSSVRHLTNEERDQIDMQARIILSKCSDRVKELEALDKKRAALASTDTNLLTRLLPSRLKQDSSSIASASRAAHNSSVTYYLNRRLAEAGQTQKEMQEERIRRQMERTRTLGSGAAREAVNMGLGDLIPVPKPVPLAGSSGTRSWLGDTASNIASTIGLPSPSIASPRPDTSQPSRSLDDEFDDDDYDDLELSASQIQQFESENATILRSVQDTLASVQQAEQRLMDISALQTELVAHLTKQSEITDQLYEDAISTTVAMEKGNEQLKEAKRRAKDGRLYILVFLVGASLALLFLHYY